MTPELNGMDKNSTVIYRNELEWHRIESERQNKLQKHQNEAD